jgi:hypothetical protein
VNWTSPERTADSFGCPLKKLVTPPPVDPPSHETRKGIEQKETEKREKKEEKEANPKGVPAS